MIPKDLIRTVHQRLNAEEKSIWEELLITRDEILKKRM